MVLTNLSASSEPSRLHEFTPQEKSVVTGLATAVFIVAGGWTVMATAVVVMGLLLLETERVFAGLVLAGGGLMALPGIFLWRSVFFLRRFLKQEEGELPLLVRSVGQMGYYFQTALMLTILAVIAGFIIGIVAAATRG